ncbi:MAG: RNA-binding protein [Clostridiales bacterium GWF2_38_85]|nr:MAG: RNA-binding protein [Clostridiales bacterium GWF2_38_85]HBL83465.1 ribosome assembly RNA-binding protein YhbY [Clostridiales bacterium]
MLTSKQRAYLRSIAANLDTIIQVGKNGMNDNVVQTIDAALTAKELIKARVFEASPLTSREAAKILAERTAADIVQVIGTRFVLYRPAKEPIIVLPK